jgi:serine/threonine protein kinase
VKLADFGFATKLSDEAAARQSLVGTTHWMAPEMLTRRGYDTKVDVWALGIVCVEVRIFSCLSFVLSFLFVLFVLSFLFISCFKMCDAEPPFWQVERRDVYAMILNEPMGPKQPEEWSRELLSFVAACLTKDPLLRPDISSLLAHPFLAAAAGARPARPGTLSPSALRIQEAIGL